jgi:transcriptional regulator
MYLPRQFLTEDRAQIFEIMRSCRLPTLVSTAEGGAPFATHLPLVVSERNGSVLIEGHVAKPNPHAALLATQPHVLAMFLGPSAYQSPSVYPDKARVPTWNYVAVHAYGQARLIEDELAKDALLKRLIAIHEPAYAAQWRDLDIAYRRRMLGAIVAFEILVEKIEGKIKLGQHRPEAHAAMRSTYENGNEAERALAGWMTRLGI